ncbi:hypothetical protein GGD81_000227 [Rhodobium orientis]|uniref:Proteophosphoglycan n=1 Tax=Rhodobium orientis TaxID=34017 RepID=A0A327JU22_9HYPH|nr:DUF1285 domain-containing protein [Rhodobium orientis]MBB4301212.1 hypothetical protein [Rhodobium orientis]MBK5951196.1 hypothetical protein [Rhodobium orientis]RAI30020.1 hypothetical protein CH339_00355 [Rhodobium orientis]
MADAESPLDALVRRAGGLKGGKPPIENWNPPDCGPIDMRIAADGTWFYMGTPIGRQPLVELFASVLRREENEEYYLVTPVEKIVIEVEDAPFVAVEMHSDGDGEGQTITLRTNVGDVVVAGPEHPLRFAVEEGTGGVKPYILVRGRLEALFARPLLYQLVDLGTTRDVDGAAHFGVWSGGTFFPILPAAELERLAQ